MEVNYTTRLKLFAEALQQEGFETSLIDAAPERPYNVLLVYLDLEKIPAKKLQLELSFIPDMETQLNGLLLLQCFVAMVTNLSVTNLPQLQKTVVSINTFCPLVGFGLLTEPPMLCFRHTLMLLPNAEHNIPVLVQTTWLISYLLEVFGHEIIQLAEGKANANEAFKDHQFKHLIFP